MTLKYQWKKRCNLKKLIKNIIFKNLQMNIIIKCLIFLLNKKEIIIQLKKRLIIKVGYQTYKNIMGKELNKLNSIQSNLKIWKMMNVLVFIKLK